MRNFFYAAAFGALSSAIALPQDIDLDLVIAAPDPTYTEAVGVTAQIVPCEYSSSDATRKFARGTC